jgi:PEP-CTERM motif
VNSGAEIDLIVETPHYDPSYLASVIFFVDVSSFHDITLTSGTTDYAGFAISGADIRINPAAFWTLDEFQLVLTHEIGHALGFADDEVSPGNLGLFSPWLDDDYDGSTSASALATLTNSFALAIDPYDPDATPLLRIPSDLNSDPGLDTPGVDILMESETSRSLAVANPVLQADDFAGRQFLYPHVPEPGSAGLLGLAAIVLAAAFRRGR